MTTEELWQPLPRAEVIKAVERKNPARIPLVRARWWGQGLGEQYGERLSEFNRYPEDESVASVSEVWVDFVIVCRRGKLP